MSKIEVPTREEVKSSHKNYLVKAKEFFQTAGDAYLRKNWNAVGLNTVHSAISANDALVIYQIGKRCISDKHNDAVKLLLFAFANDTEVKKQSRHLSWLIAKKNIVEYELRLFQEKEAIDALKHAERFLNWINSKIL